MTNDIEELLTPEEVAALLKVERNTIYIWLRANELKGVKVGDLWRVRKSDLNEFLTKTGK